MTLQYNFSNPGARSLGLGGAFVALAVDLSDPADTASVSAVYSF